MQIHIGQAEQCRQAVALLLSCLCLARANPPPLPPVSVTAPSPAEERLPDVGVLKHHTGRYTVVGTNRVWNASLMRWVETMEQRVAGITGLANPFSQRRIKIVIPREQERGGGVTWSQGFEGRMFLQQLTVHDYAHGDLDQSELAICGLLLNGYLLDAPPPASMVSGAPGPSERVIVAPSWLAVGVARNLYPRFRARDGATVLALWGAGRAPSLRQLLGQLNATDAKVVVAPALAGFFVTWLNALPERAHGFQSLFSHLAAGLPLSATWLVSIVPDCETINAVDARWDAWIMREKRVIREPGITTAPLVQQLRLELRIQGAERARQEGAADFVALPFDGLIGRRKEPWVREVAGRKAARLRVLFVGRGDDVKQVVDAYADFLVALSRGKRASLLREALEEADGLMRTLEQAYGLGTSAAETVPGPTNPIVTPTYRLDPLFPAGGAAPSSAFPSPWPDAGPPDEHGLFLWHHLAPRTVRPPSLPAGHAHPYCT